MFAGTDTPQGVKKAEVQETLPPAGVLWVEPLSLVLQHFPCEQT